MANEADAAIVYATRVHDFYVIAVVLLESQSSVFDSGSGKHHYDIGEPRYRVTVNCIDDEMDVWHLGKTHYEL